MTCVSPLIVALDYPDAHSALAMADRLDCQKCRVKVGKELFTRVGPSIVGQLRERGFDVFLDLKFHDIPNTTSQAVKAAAELGVWMVNIHASGGRRMMEACREMIDAATVDKKPLLIAVTVLTSMSAEDLAELGCGVPAEQVLRLATLAQGSGMDGVVCSALEVGLLRESLGQSLTLVTPGIRPEGAAHHDQRRIVSPAQAVANGSDYLVVGRPVTQADNPIQVLDTLLASL